VASIAAPILLADISDHCFGVFGLDPKRGDERVLCIHGDVVRLTFQLQTDGKLRQLISSSRYLGTDIKLCPAKCSHGAALVFSCAHSPTCDGQNQALHFAFRLAFGLASLTPGPPSSFQITVLLEPI
jgi:hypothetical protein